MPKIGNRSALERALADIIEQPLQPDEFTVACILVKSEGASYDSVACKVERLLKQGQLTKRKITINGTPTNAYRYV